MLKDKEKKLKAQIKQLQQSKEFWALPKAEKAVVIAKDILKQIKSKKYKVTTGDYVNIETTYSLEEEADIQEVFDEINYCEVCAIGAACVSIAHIGDGLTYHDFTYSPQHSPNLTKVLRKVFDDVTLYAMENAFEGIGGSDVRFAEDLGFDTNSVSSDIKRKIQKFHEKYDNDGNRLVAIMKNIIKNKGKFIL
jgi:hypothetical protein